MPFKRKDKKGFVAAMTNQRAVEEINSTTLLELLSRLSTLENDTQELLMLLDEIRAVRNELEITKNKHLQIFQDVQTMFNEINLKTISNEKTALRMQTLDLRMSIEIANNGIVV